jgi:hypothetical protein
LIWLLTWVRFPSPAPFTYACNPVSEAGFFFSDGGISQSPQRKKVRQSVQESPQKLYQSKFF